MKKAVIIGAGQTGRGFIAPIVQENGYAITFLDKDHALVEQLRKEKEYTVSYFGGKREPQHISGYSALTTDEKEAVNGGGRRGICQCFCQSCRGARRAPR